MDDSVLVEINLRARPYRSYLKIF